MINLDDVKDGIKELERAARLGLAGAMITSIRSSTGATTNPSTSRSGPPPQPRHEGVLSGAVDMRSDLLRCLRASSRLTLAIVEFELAWAPNVITFMDYTYCDVVRLTAPR